MKSLRKYLNRIKPDFEPGGKYQSFRSVFDGFETFLFTPNTTSKSGVNIHDSLDSKRVMIIVVLALIPCLLFGIYNIGYQRWLSIGAEDFPFGELFAYGLIAMLPRIFVTYIVGL
ncbi:MAG: RnfABCDGE type electron transport complex subunit D, partial [Muribaculaceae bacterium]|nr:RnfABCDGE type electron transport complex subunit D [Muribaculaceae bacterium]